MKLDDISKALYIFPDLEKEYKEALKKKALLIRAPSVKVPSPG